MTLTETTTVPQHMEALMLANSRRFGRARFKRGVEKLNRREGCAVLAEELREANWCNGVGSMPLEKFLQAAHRVGPSAAMRIIARAGVGAHRASSRLDALTERERLALAVTLEAGRTA